MNSQMSRLIIGAVIATIGAALLIDGLNIADTSSILREWWPLLIVVGGISMFIDDSKSYVWALAVIGIGVFVQLRVLGYYSDINVWQVLWPLTLIAVGVSIALKRPAVPYRKAEAGSDTIVAILGSSDQKNIADDFTGSKVTAIMGGAKIDLRNATVKKAATIEVFALMGGIELVVPRTVIINNQTNAILGGVENKTDQDTTKSSPTLTVVGDVILGGVEIKN